MLDFWIPLLLLFFAASVTAIISRRKKDRCLRYFSKKDVVIGLDSGKWLWGKMIPFPQQLELLFQSPVPDDNGFSKASYVLYEPEINTVSRIFRPQPETGTKEFHKWEKEIHRIANPSLFRRFRRWMFNILNTLRDAVSQSIGMIVGTLKSKTAMGKVIGADKRAGEISNTILGTVPNAYEPVLERYICKQVVVEMVENGTSVEYAGLLQEYSEKYLLLRKVSYHPEFETDAPLPDQFDIIFPRKKALVRHRLQ